MFVVDLIVSYANCVSFNIILPVILFLHSEYCFT